MQIDKSIPICNYDPAWVQRFEQEKSAILGAIGELIVKVEHFGSTAVPGLAAKPIVDILAGLKQHPMPNESIHVLEQIGYEYLGEAGVPRPLVFGLKPRHTNEFGASAYWALIQESKSSERQPPHGHLANE